MLGMVTMAQRKIPLVFCVIICVFILTPVHIYADTGLSGDGVSAGLFDVTTMTGAVGLIGVGGAGAVITTYNKKRRQHRLVKNKQLPEKEPIVKEPKIEMHC